MSNKDKIRSEMVALNKAGAALASAFQEKKNETTFHYEYQDWYSKALKVVTLLAPDRLAEFRGYYQIDPKRKTLGYGTYTIQDFLKGVVPNRVAHPEFDTHYQAFLCFFNQLTIFNSILKRIDSALGDVEGALYADLQDYEIEVAKKLANVNLRAAGALTGVVIEGHLQKVAAARDVTIAKKNPTIADLNDPLKAANVIDIPTWRKISYLADIRNLCSHKKDREPTKEEVNELINGAEWISKNVY